jgi:hypothetical protein
MNPQKQRYENLQHAYFGTDGKYDIPKLIGSQRTDIPELVKFRHARTAENKADKGVHFFIDDFRFTGLWNKPQMYLDLLRQFRFVLSPDFSLYTDFPKAIQIYNHYRKHWLGAYWEENGIEVIPTIGWSDESSFDWCFDGEPVGGTVAVSSVGTQNSKAAKANFLAGYAEMMKRLKPETVIFYGAVPEECSGNIVKVPSSQEIISKLKSEGKFTREVRL